MTIAEHLRDFFRTCPMLKNKRIDIDCLSEHADSFSIDADPGETSVKRYLDGSSVRRNVFYLSGRTYYGDDLKQQAQNIACFEQIEEWMEQQNLLHNQPDLGNMRFVRTFHALTAGYPYVINEDTGLARYQITLELIYTQEVF